jgi:hypothetical protein
MARVASPRWARAAPEVMGETAATPGRWASKVAIACQLVMVCRRCARAWVSLQRTVPACGGKAGVTRSSNGETLTWACAPKVFSRVLRCRPVMRAEM